MKIGFRDTGLLSNRASKVRIALFSMLAIAAATGSTAHAVDCTPSLYGTSYDKQVDPSAIFNSINIANGIGTQIGPTGFDRISAMDVDPTSDILYAVAERHNEIQKVLISIDRQTGIGTQIAELSFGDDLDHEQIAGMSFDSSGKLYGYGSWDQGFYTIDVLAGTIERLGVNNSGNPLYGNALAFSPVDILYYVGDEDLYTVNLTTGLPTFWSGLDYSIFLPTPNVPKVAAMDYAPETGFYYAIVKDGNQGETHLATIDIATGVVDKIGSTADNMDGMAYFCEPVILGDVIFEDGFESP